MAEGAPPSTYVRRRMRALVIMLPEKLPSSETCTADLRNERLGAATLLTFKAWTLGILREALLGEHTTWSAAAQAFRNELKGKNDSSHGTLAATDPLYVIENLYAYGDWNVGK